VHRHTSQRILAHQHEPGRLLRAYIAEWQRFHDQSLYLFEPFRTLSDGSGSALRRASPQLQPRPGAAQPPPHEDNVVRKVRPCASERVDRRQTAR